MPIEESRCMFSVVATTTTKVPLLAVIRRIVFPFSSVSFVFVFSFFDSSFQSGIRVHRPDRLDEDQPRSGG